jgi:hypothetical protein
MNHETVTAAQPTRDKPHMQPYGGYYVSQIPAHDARSGRS